MFRIGDIGSNDSQIETAIQQNTQTTKGKAQSPKVGPETAQLAKQLKDLSAEVALATLNTPDSGTTVGKDKANSTVTLEQLAAGEIDPEELDLNSLTQEEANEIISNMTEAQLEQVILNNNNLSIEIKKLQEIPNIKIDDLAGFLERNYQSLGIPEQSLNKMYLKLEHMGKNGITTFDRISEASQDVKTSFRKLCKYITQLGLPAITLAILGPAGVPIALGGAIASGVAANIYTRDLTRTIEETTRDQDQDRHLRKSLIETQSRTLDISIRALEDAAKIKEKIEIARAQGETQETIEEMQNELNNILKQLSYVIDNGEETIVKLHERLDDNEIRRQRDSQLRKLAQSNDRATRERAVSQMRELRYGSKDDLTTLDKDAKQKPLLDTLSKLGHHDPQLEGLNSIMGKNYLPEDKLDAASRTLSDGIKHYIGEPVENDYSQMFKDIDEQYTHKDMARFLPQGEHS